MYLNWPHRAQTASQLKWYKLTDLLDYCHELRSFIIDAPGKLSACYVPLLEATESLMDQHKRFPKEDIYISEGYGDWCLQIDQLCLTVAIVLYPNKLVRQYPTIKTQGEAEVHVLSCIDTLLKMAERLECVFDQQLYETRYGLHWETHEKE
ncbi:hypothetical protein BDF14DRAFT_1779799 [Spinellus fusiger]|nr:hypothetical protein BDF14DRAFT_1779799 [Spinellus fusiger]